MIAHDTLLEKRIVRNHILVSWVKWYYFTPGFPALQKGMFAKRKYIGRGEVISSQPIVWILNKKINLSDICFLRKYFLEQLSADRHKRKSLNYL